MNVLKALGGNIYFDIVAGHNLLSCNFEIASQYLLDTSQGPARALDDPGSRWPLYTGWI